MIDLKVALNYNELCIYSEKECEYLSIKNKKRHTLCKKRIKFGIYYIKETIILTG